MLLEVDDAMRRWTVTNGIPVDPKARRIAIEQPPVPPAGRKREGRTAVLPLTGEPVSLWDAGEWYSAGDAGGYDAGHLRFRLHGKRLQGRWALVRMSGAGAVERPPWLLILTSL
ncbi:DNA polymerase ligase N-terminal domain-containing protein [Achromobacter aegrifaciens]|uniref:DNA polymerase ligase N-terminal domain-containing protein n=2 Tax=Alcaligenaceae TaxID=506 RepID=UPI0009E74A20|nr:DNA polymerase ligase N-terminal domain-containing protein [Achromobacter aegrifaciens]